jgi:hypothetical protein
LRGSSRFSSRKKYKQHNKRRHKSKINQISLLGDAPIMSIIKDKIKSTSKIKSKTSISPELSTTIETVNDNDEAALEKLIDSAEDNLDDVIAYKSLATVPKPDYIISGIATSDFFGDD